jgi:hypothetical protein
MDVTVTFQSRMPAWSHLEISELDRKGGIAFEEDLSGHGPKGVSLLFVGQNRDAFPLEAPGKGPANQRFAHALIMTDREIRVNSRLINLT